MPVKIMWIAKDKCYGVCVFEDKPIWDESEDKFIEDKDVFQQNSFQIDDRFGESLEIGQCAKVVGLTLGEVETFGEVKR